MLLLNLVFYIPRYIYFYIPSQQDIYLFKTSKETFVTTSQQRTSVGMESMSGWPT